MYYNMALCTAALLRELQPAPLFPVSSIIGRTDKSRCVWLWLLWLLRSGTPELISLSNNGRQETKELPGVLEVVQLCIKQIV